MSRTSGILSTWIFFVFFLFATDAFATASLEYIVSMPKPSNHYFEVKILLKDFTKDYVDFKMPVWTPGSYLIREYERNVEGFFTTKSNGTPLKHEKINKNTWRVYHKKAGDIVIGYSVYAFDGSVRMSYLDENHAFIMANTLFMYTDELRFMPVTLKLHIPDYWKNVSTSLKTGHEKNTFLAKNYDELVDSPIEIGNHEIIQFTAAGVPHEMAMYGRTFFDKEALQNDLTKLIETATAIFGDNPNETYVFIVHNQNTGGGGLEHMGSTVLNVRRNIYQSNYNSFLTLATHEYFHLWLVKRIKPVAFEVLDYDRENYTDLLWFMEGVTSYYEEKVMLRNGYFDATTFLDRLVKAMANLTNTPGAEVQSVAQASFDAWIKYYRQNENSYNDQVSYYSKGMILGALLDLAIIHNSEGRQSLDDVLRYLYENFYKKGRGITTKDLQKACEITGGMSFKQFFDSYIYGTQPLPNSEFLQYAGVRLLQLKNDLKPISLGLRLTQKNGATVISSVKKGSPAFEAGLSAGDELIALDDFRVSKNDLNSILDNYDPGSRILLTISRDGLVLSKEIEARRDNSVVYAFEQIEEKSPLQQKVSEVWLGL